MSLEVSACGKPCAGCPFLRNAKTAYDADALEALDQGLSPACYELSGPDAIFAEPFPCEDLLCRGFQRWEAGDSRMVRPQSALAA